MSDANRTGNVAEGNRLFFNRAQDFDDPAAAAIRVRAILKHLQALPKKESLADIGCHNGVRTCEYARVPGVKTVDGFDIADEALKEAVSRGIRARRWNMGTEPCPAGDAVYDALVASEVIEHIVDTEFFIAELRRILKSGGHVVLTTPNLFYWINRIKFITGKVPWNYPGASSAFKSDANVNTEHIRVHGLREWAAFFEARGFEVIHAGGAGRIPPGSLKNSLLYWIDNIVPAAAKCLCVFLLRKK